MKVQRKRIRPSRRKANHVIKQIPRFEIPGNQYIDKVVDVTLRSQRQVPTAQTVHRQWRLTRCSLSTQRYTALNNCSNQFNSSIAKVHQAEFREETNPRDHAKTGSDDPEGANKQVSGPKMNKAEAQLNRVRSSGDTGSSERRAD